MAGHRTEYVWGFNLWVPFDSCLQRDGYLGKVVEVKPENLLQSSRSGNEIAQVMGDLPPVSGRGTNSRVFR